MKIERALTLVREEMDRTAKKHPSFHSPHEGFCVLLEEVHELWDVIRRHQGTGVPGLAKRDEAVQVAAMAIRFLTDCC